jgi:hypothetical protein
MQSLARLACAVSLLLPACAAAPTAVAPAITSAGVRGAAPVAKSEPAVEVPSLDLAFESAIKGEANGVPVELTRVRVQGDDQGWYLMLEQEAPEAGATGPRYGWNQFHIAFAASPTSKKTMSRALATGDGFFQVTDPTQADNGTGSSTINWQRSKNTWSIEFTKWEVSSEGSQGGVEQKAGKASGRVVLMLKDAGQRAGTPLKDSWVAGTFTDVPVSFVGTPPSSEKVQERSRWITAAE